MTEMPKLDNHTDYFCRKCNKMFKKTECRTISCDCASYQDEDDCGIPDSAIYLNHFRKDQLKERIEWLLVNAENKLKMAKKEDDSLRDGNTNLCNDPERYRTLEWSYYFHLNYAKELEKDLKEAFKEILEEKESE